MRLSAHSLKINNELYFVITMCVIVHWSPDHRHQIMIKARVRGPSLFDVYGQTTECARRKVGSVLSRVAWQDGPRGKTRPVDNLKPPSTFKSHVEQCYQLQDTCYERRASGNRRKLNYVIFNIYTCFSLIFSHYYMDTCPSPLYISDNKERNMSS